MQRRAESGSRRSQAAVARTAERVFASSPHDPILGSRARVYALVLAALAALLSLVALVAYDAQGRLHEAPVSVVAEPIMMTGLADDLGSGTVIRQTVDERAAIRDLDEGTSRAVLIVDLSTTQDTVVIPTGQDARAVATLVAQLRAAEALRGRTVSVHIRLVPAGAVRVRALATGAIVVGFLIAALLSLGWGAAAHRFHLRVRVAATILVGAAALVVTSLLGWVAALCLVLIVVLAVVVTLALEALFGWTGFTVAAALTLMWMWPWVLGMDLVFVPGWWQALWHWSPAGSATCALRSAMVDGIAGPVHHGMQLWAWLLCGLLTLALSRRLPYQLDAVALPWRRRIGAVVLGFTLLALAAVALAPEPGVASQSSPTLRANRLSACTPIPEVDSVADLNRITRLPGTSDFAGADVGLNVSLQDGRTLWVFADTLREQAGLVRNSMLVADNRCLRAVVPAEGGAVIPNRSHSPVGYWPMSAIAIRLPGYDLVPVWSQRVVQRGPGVFGFQTLGPTVAVFVVRAGAVPQLVAMRDLAPDLPDLRRPMWGAAAAVDGDWVYLYGTANNGLDLGFSVQVARVRIDEILDPAALQYWDGFAWSDAPGSAAQLIPSAGGTSQTFSIVHRGDAWYALSKQDEFLGSNLRLWVASAPTGPFLEGPVLAALPSVLQSGHLVYMALAHPDVLPEEGSMVVSYSRNDVNFQHIVDDPDQYRPRFLRVWFP